MVKDGIDGKGAMHSGSSEEKWHVRTKHSNVIIWQYKGRVIINFSIFTFQRTLLFIKLSVTNGEGCSRATMRKGGSKFPPATDWSSVFIWKIKGQDSFRDGQEKKCV